MYPSIQDHIMFHDPPTNPLCSNYSSLLSQVVKQLSTHLPMREIQETQV